MTRPTERTVVPNPRTGLTGTIPGGDEVPCSTDAVRHIDKSKAEWSHNLVESRDWDWECLRGPSAENEKEFLSDTRADDP